jgi:hypothetical protein
VALAGELQKAYHIMKALPEPINQIRADINSAGITIHPFPVGTTFFEGHPKNSLLQGSSPSRFIVLVVDRHEVHP